MRFVPYCPECGSRVGPDRERCQICRAELVALRNPLEGRRCTRCGEVTSKAHSYCFRCGYQLGGGQQLAFALKNEIKSRNKSGSLNIAGIAVIVLVIFAAFAITGFLSYNPIGASYGITVQQVDVKFVFTGGVSGYSGSYPDVVLSGPYYSMPGSEFTLAVAIPSNPTPITLEISSISSSTSGFSVVSVTPAPPIVQTPGSSLALLVVIQTPPEKFTGELTLNIFIS
jgi:hypothetical protein